MYTYLHTCAANRTEPNLNDLAQAFASLGVTIPDIKEFRCGVVSSGPSPDVPQYPMHVRKPSSHVRDALPGSEVVIVRKRRHASGSGGEGESEKEEEEEEEEEEEYIPSYLPPLPDPKGKDDIGELLVVVGMYMYTYMYL